MAAKSRRKTYRHGNLKAAATGVAYDLVARAGHASLSLRQVADTVGVVHRSLYNHFKDREALLDAVATEGFARLAAKLTKAQTADDFTEKYVRFALAHPSIYALMASRPHATMKNNPPLQAAAHGVITQAMRIFCDADQTSAQRRRTVMKVYMIHYGCISLYASGILDIASEKTLIAEVSAMTSRI